MVARTGLFVAPLPGSTPAGTSPTDGRLVLGSLFGTGPGCLSGGAFTPSATAMQISVGQTVWRISDPTNAAGVYLSPADPFTFTVSAGPASGSRIDVLWVRQNNYEAGDADSRVTYGIAAGVAAAAPVAPALPAGAMKVATLTVPTGASNAAACTLAVAWPQTITQPNLVATTVAQLPAAGGFYGQLATVAQVSVAGATIPVIYRWNGTAWKAWDSDWSSYTPDVLGVVGGAFASPGWIPKGRWRYTAGRVAIEAGWLMNGGAAAINSNPWMSLPVPGDITDSQVFGYFDRPNGLGWFYKSSTSALYRLEVDWAQSGNPNYVVVLAYRGSTPNGLVGPFGGFQPATPAQSDTFMFNLTYDPA